MSLIDRLFGRKKAAPPVAYPSWALATAEAQRWEVPDLALPDAQAALMLKLSWVNAAIGAVARSVALETLSVYTMQGEKKKDVENHDFEKLLLRPNANQSRYEFLYGVAAWTKLTGNAYIWLNRRNPKQPPAEMWILPSNQVKPVPDGRMYIRGYVYDPGDGKQIPLEPWEVCHVKNFHPSNAFVGASDIESLAVAAETDWSMARWNAKFFSKDNAKFPGVLLFADMVGNDEWEKIKRDFKEQSGGTERSLRMLRGVGPGGVQWLQTSMSQTDMEFLQGRLQTRDEIFAVLAPGFSSIISVNATMANSEVGKRTFMEEAVWPLCVQIHERLTLDVLPAYGEGLVAEFDDPRITDQVLELQQRAEWSKVHTVKEAREKWDGDGPLGDDRDELLVPQVSQLGGKPEVEKDNPTPPGLLPFTGQTPEENAQEGEPDAETEEQPDEGDDGAGALEQARAAEMGKWRRYAGKHGAEKARGFKAELLPADVASVIRDRLALAESAEEVKAAFSGPFLVKADRVAIGGMTDPIGAEKDRAETRIERAVLAKFEEALPEIIEMAGDPPDESKIDEEYWLALILALALLLRPELEKVAIAAAGANMGGAGSTLDWVEVLDRISDWAAAQSRRAAEQIVATTRAKLRAKIAAIVSTVGRTAAELASDMAAWFGRARAVNISITEVTGAAGAAVAILAGMAALAGTPVDEMWHTMRDERVCPVCYPNDHKLRSEGWTVAGHPPVHNNCRCFTHVEWRKF